MIRTAARAASAKRPIRSLALSVYFKHPDLGMKDYEILSRASAFLLSVDPPKDEYKEGEGPFSHLATSERERENLILKQSYSPDAAGGPKRDVKDLSWLEFCPGRHRPLAHVVTSSHVLSPWLWKQYYPQPWLSVVTQEHVRYSVDVFDHPEGDSTKDKIKREPLATFALNPYPIHHPVQLDLAILHIKQEETVLKHMESLGVEMMHLRENETLFDRGDEVAFEGFELAEEHYEHLEKLGNDPGQSYSQESSCEDDTRVFIPYTETGNLLFASTDRFLTSTPTPLPEGLCGGPVIDKDDRVCGIVEGIVPKDHEDEKIAGAASFIPSFRIRDFIEYAEKIMLQEILPKRVFDKVVEMKKGLPLNHSSNKIDLGLVDPNEEGTNEMYHKAMESLRKTHSAEQVEAILDTIEKEQKEVMDIIEREGGDLDDVIASVRQKTIERQLEIIEKGNNIQEAEILSERNSNNDGKK